MGFFESCSTMPAWRAWILAAGTSLAALTCSCIYHQVKIILSTLKCIPILLLVFSSNVFMWFTNASGI